jgi:lysophospholipase L1-like esterase
MKSKVVLLLTTCAILGIAATGTLWAQAAPAAPGGAVPGVAAPGGGATRGGARGGGAMGGARGGTMGRGGIGRGAPPGPPAPVPPEVAMPRPTAEELARINADLKQFVETTSSPNKDLMKKYQSLLTVQMPPDNPCIRPTQGGGRHAALVELANTGDYDIMFVGDSITELLGADADPQGNPGGKPQVEKYFSDVKVGNFGISGDTTQGVLWRFQNGEGQGHKPKAIMVMLGTNNMNGNITGPMVAEGIGAVILELRKDFPDSKILLVAIFPRGSGPNDANRRKVEECNKIIAKLDDQKHVFFVNLNDKFLTPEGKLIGFRTSDNLHPVTQGFDIWLSSVAPTLKSWVK